MTRIENNIQTTQASNGSPPPLSLNDFQQFSSQPGVDANAQNEVFGQGVEIAGITGIARWAARSLGRASDNLANGVSRGHMQR
ncbi:MAG: hypothetical protein AAFN74_16320, partial [Myxococcota bacterium]